MRSVNLLKIAAEAETLHIRALLARQARRAVFGAIAIIFALAVLALAEIAGWQTLRLYVTGIPATLILLGINLVIAGEEDPRCPIEGITPWVDALRSRGVSVDVHLYPEGHHASAVTQRVRHMELILAFFRRYI